MVEQLVLKVGFGWAMRICAFLILFLSVIAFLTIRSRIPPSPAPFRFMDFVDPLFELPYLFTGISSFLFYFGLFVPFTYIVLSGTANGMSQNLAGYLVPILNATSEHQSGSRCANLEDSANRKPSWLDFLSQRSGELAWVADSGSIN
ncbi:MAG: hypothetical protein Q9160_001553 [Pyrenula sp. 1 TL-2023]